MKAFSEKQRGDHMGSSQGALRGKGMYINKRHACLGSDKNVFGVMEWK